MKDSMFLLLSVFLVFGFLDFLFRHIGCISDHSFSIVFVTHSVDVLSKPLLLYLAYWPGVLLFALSLNWVQLRL